MGGYLNKIGLHGHPFDTDVRVLKEPRTVPYNRIGSLERIRTVSVPYRTVSRGTAMRYRESYGKTSSTRMHSDQRGNSMTIGKPFQKGHSGNPGGRPKVVAEVKELARTHTGKAIETLVSIMDQSQGCTSGESVCCKRFTRPRLWEAAAAHHGRGWAVFRRTPARASQGR